MKKVALLGCGLVGSFIGTIIKREGKFKLSIFDISKEDKPEEL